MKTLETGISLNQQLSSEKRKKMLERRAVQRELEVDDRVLLTTPGIDSKLTDAWKGPYTILRREVRTQIKGEYDYDCTRGRYKQW